MAWVGLHTGPNIDPHATLAWWPDSDPRPAVALHIAKHLSRTLHRTQVWVARKDHFGVRNDIEVAVLEPNATVSYGVDVCKTLHKSDWPINPHVTCHKDRLTFTFQFVGLHLPNEERYWRLPL